jgi:hypothetical protein
VTGIPAVSIRELFFSRTILGLGTYRWQIQLHRKNKWLVLDGT